LIKKISDKDKKAWEKFVNSKDRLHNKDNQNKIDSILNLERSIDLHGYSLLDANTVIEKFLLKCYANGATKINIITGKGSRSKNKDDPYQAKDLSILKYSVPNFINENKELMKIIMKIDFDSVYNPSKGNFLIYLKKND
jgi:DNA-nicking Smr family endonuclease|tara:strand:+ start:202 stop:618 length:417 start_codon:yes stop_codon:yes gene_type:complete